MATVTKTSCISVYNGGTYGQTYPTFTSKITDSSSTTNMYCGVFTYSDTTSYQIIDIGFTVSASGYYQVSFGKAYVNGAMNNGTTTTHWMVTTTALTSSNYTWGDQTKLCNGNTTSFVVKAGASTTVTTSTASSGTYLTAGTTYHLWTCGTGTSARWSAGAHQVLGDDYYTISLKTCYAIAYNKGDATSGSAPSGQGKIPSTDLTLRKNTGSLAKTAKLTLAYNVNGGSGTISSNTGSAASFTNNGWGTSSGTTTKAYAFGGTYSTDAKATFYPAWTTAKVTASATVTSSTPTRTGYTFLGWSTSSSATSASYDGGDTYSASIASSTTVTLYAVWKIITYTVSYNAGDASSGTAPSSQTKTYGVALTLAKDPGFKKSSTSTSTSTTGAITLSYNVNGGSGTISSNTGSSVTIPGTITTSYSASGWSKTKGSTSATYSFGGSYTTNSAITLYPSWSTSSSTSWTSTTASVTASSTKPTRTGYTFGGWATSASSTTVAVAAGGTYSTGITASKTVTLYAIWNIITYSVTYNKGDATSGSAPSSQTKTYGTALTLQTNSGSLAHSNGSGSTSTTGAITLAYDANGGTGAPSGNTGTSVTISGTYPITYTASGWGTSSGTTTATYAFGGSYTTNAALSLYPAWTKTNGSTTWTATSASATVSSTTPTRTGYTFLGWSTSSSATTASYAAGGTYTESITASKTQTLYAVWKIITYTVAYNAGDATSGTVPSDQTKTYGTDLTLQENTGSLEHDPDINTAVKIVPMTLKYNANGGTNPPASTEDPNVCIDGYYNTVYTNNGWGTEGGTTTKAYDFGGIYTTNAAITLYPAWTKTDTEIRWEAKTTSLQVTSGSPIRDGYELIGWDEDSSVEEPTYKAGDYYTATISTDTTVTLYAIWKEVETLVYIYDGTKWVTATIYISGVHDSGELIWKKAIPKIYNGEWK